MIYSRITFDDDAQTFRDPTDSYPIIGPCYILWAVTQFPCASLCMNLLCILLENCTGNDNLSQESAFIRRNQQRPLLLQHCISTLIFRYQICLFRSLLSDFSFLSCSFATPNIFKRKHPSFSKVLHDNVTILYQYLGRNTYYWIFILKKSFIFVIW